MSYIKKALEPSNELSDAYPEVVQSTEESDGSCPVESFDPYYDSINDYLINIA